MPRHQVRLMLALMLSFGALVAPSAIAGTRSRLEQSTFGPLRAPLRDGASVQIRNLPLVDRNETLVLEEFDVLAPDAVIHVYDAEDKPHVVTPQAMRHFRGAVAGDPESIVYLSTRGSRVNGIIISRDTKFSVWSERRPMMRQGSDAAEEIFIEELSGADEAEMFQTFTCGVEKMTVGNIPAGLPKSLASGPANVKTAAALTGTQRTVLNLAVETDTALYTNFASNAANTETFVRDLIAATSTIYVRDLKTELRITYLGVHTAADPFAATPGIAGTWNGNAVTFDASHAMLELGDRWHTSNPSPTSPRSATMLLSGDNDLAGIAWVDTLCTGDFFCDPNLGYPEPYANHWGGSYSFNGGIGLNATDRTVPNPDALANFGAPNNGYWPLLQVAHELGHNVQSAHTHCVQLTEPEKTQFSVSRNFVDICRSGEGGCYSGAQSLPAEAPSGRGSIMSYCHLLAFGNGTRFTFGQTGEAAIKITNAMRSRLDEKTPGLSAITAPAAVAAGGSGTASVTNAGLTYTWTITNGTFTGGGTTATGASVNFTGNTNPVTLKVIGTNASGCAITDSKTVSISAISAPTNVVATASSTTNVSVTWTTVGGATSYNVYRSTDGTNFSLAGSPSGPPFVDTGRTANTAYIYKVRAVNGSESGDSNRDFTVTSVYTDAVISQNSTSIKTIHFSQLATAANALRTAAGIGAIAFSQGSPASSGLVRRSHVTELRAGIDLARTTLGFTAGSYTTDGAITIANTTIKKAHVDQLRAALQ
jgi:Metallo-peptidase family M12